MCRYFREEMNRVILQVGKIRPHNHKNVGEATT